MVSGEPGMLRPLETVHLGHVTAQLGTFKLTTETHISATWFDVARPKVPMEKP